MSIKRRLIRNIGASAFGKISGAIATFLSVPMFLSLLGWEKYSAWLVVSAIPVWLSMADIGFGSVAANEMSLRVSRGDWTGAERIFQSAWAAIFGFTGFSIIGIVALGILLPWSSLLSINSVSSTELSITVIALGCSSLIALQGALFAGLFRAKGRAEMAIFLGGVKPLFDVVFIFIALFIFRNLIAASVALLISQLAYITSGTIWGLRCCREIKLGINGCNREDLKLCIRKGVAFCVFPIGNAFVLQGATLVVNHALGAAAVVVFNTCRTLVRSAQQILNLLGQSVWPEFSHLVGAGDWSRARRLHHITLASNLIVAIGISLVILTIGPLIYNVWTRHQLHVDRMLMLPFIASILTNALWFCASTIVSASNRHERFAIFYLLGSILSIVICYFLSIKFGIEGAAISALTLDVVIGPLVIGEALKITRDNYIGLSLGTFGSIYHTIGRLTFKWKICN